MQARKLPFAYGYLWIQQGWRLFRSQPLALLSWSLATHILIQFSFFIPMLGQAILLTLTPCLTFISLNICQRVEQGELVRVHHWFEPLQAGSQRPALIRLGFLYMACSLLIAFLAIFPFLNDFRAAIGTDGELHIEPLMAAMKKPMFLFWVLYVLLSGLFWHGPALVGWHRIPIKKALFYSMVACWRNKWAFLAYGGIWLALLYATGQFSLFLIGSGTSAVFAQFILTPLELILMAVLYASFYPAYQSIFKPSLQAHQDHTV